MFLICFSSNFSWLEHAIITEALDWFPLLLLETSTHCTFRYCSSYSFSASVIVTFSSIFLLPPNVLFSLLHSGGISPVTHPQKLSQALFILLCNPSIEFLIFALVFFRRSIGIFCFLSLPGHFYSFQGLEDIFKLDFYFFLLFFKHSRHSWHTTCVSATPLLPSVWEQRLVVILSHRTFPLSA